MIHRRKLLACLGANALTAPLAALAQQVVKPAGKLWRIGYLAVVDPAATPHLQAFRDGLRQLGLIEGKTIEIDYNWSPDTRVRSGSPCPTS